MYGRKREGIDEATMTFNDVDLLRLRLLYEWQSAGQNSAEPSEIEKLPATLAKLAEEKDRILLAEAEH